MEVVRIGDHKMKITLNSEELVEHGLDTGEEYRDTAVIRRNVWSVIEKASKKSGISIKGEKLLIQFYPTKGGSLEIFVTKLGILTEASARLVCSSDRITLLSKRRSTYKIENKDDLISLLYAAKKCKEAEVLISSIYVSPYGDYYIVIDELGCGTTPELIALSDFATHLPEGLEGYVSEHFIRLCDKIPLSDFSIP